MTVAKGWAVNPEPWMAAFDATRECAWKRVHLHSDNRRLVPDKPGVYVMCVTPRDIRLTGKLFENLTTAIYVGKATNLRVRFGQHIRGDRPGLKQAAQTFRRIDFYYTTLHQARLSYVEQCLIDALGPSVNSMNATRTKIGGEIKAHVEDGIPLRRS